MIITVISFPLLLSAAFAVGYVFTAGEVDYRYIFNNIIFKIICHHLLSLPQIIVKHLPLDDIRPLDLVVKLSVTYDTQGRLYTETYPILYPYNDMLPKMPQTILQHLIGHLY